MKIEVKTYEELEQKEIELVKDGYRLLDITDRYVVFSRCTCGIYIKVMLEPMFWGEV